MLPIHECIVAEIAPGRDANGSAPILLANTTASAEFCMPVSIDIVRPVFSEKLKSFGMVYPTRKPTECSSRTLVKMLLRVCEVMAAMFEFCATTPPHMRDTSKTLANGVNLDIALHNAGAF